MGWWDYYWALAPPPKPGSNPATADSTFRRVSLSGKLEPILGLGKWPTTPGLVSGD
ncbi:hypothetical protein chiPu_0033711, partial [Chiloscyllium punctatum]|nr:hypothetical protein [Chiloscyllium punctatum]